MEPTRREFLGTVGSVAASGFGCRPGAETAAPPNILFLLTDDQRHDMFGAGGNPIIRTPNMDRLASEGVMFTHNYVTTSICAVSRASFFTGLYARCHGIHGFATPLSEEQHALSYPVRLRDAGYHTGFVGKYGVGRAEHIEDAASRYDYFEGWPGQGQYLVPGRAHMTEHLGNQAIDFLEGAPAGQPWNLSVSFKAPHVQDRVDPYFINDPRLDDMYDGLRLQPFPHMDGAYYDSLPEFLKADTESRVRWERRFGSPEKWEESVKRYYALIHGVDIQIGRMLERIAAMGQLDNTVVIFTGDNGFFLGERGWAGKWYMHEESIRTPMIVRDPRLVHRAGTRRSEMTLNIDVCPTILDAAGLETPESMNGRSLMPLARGGSPGWRREWFYEHLFEHPQVPKSEGVHTGDWKYFVFPEAEPPHEEMYHLAVDPLETINLAGSADRAEKLAELRSRRREWIANLESWQIDRSWNEPSVSEG
ncbi:MAG: sulfatase [Bryobacterales bacterium]|nr:sulfatase [Bryobacterales bacterium]MDE0627620.1 sulfatase [Bryobacterales bacterium]